VDRLPFVVLSNIPSGDSDKDPIPTVEQVDSVIDANGSVAAIEQVDTVADVMERDWFMGDRAKNSR
jgi:hypothetical protein